MNIIDISGVSKRFGTYEALADIDLHVAKGEIVTLLGPSGCGKTTLMRLIAGFEDVSGGKLAIAGRDTAGLPPEKRPVNMVFQRYALFPHLDVYENVAYGLRVKKLPKTEVDRKVRAMLDIVQLSHLSQRYINELSGGQCQRVALARALVNEPEVLLMDEPLAALDLKIRQHMLEEMKRIHAQTGTTFIYVTHDQDEALILSDRIVLMDRGRIVQIDRPGVMYAQPQTLFAAKFLGETNLFDATLQRRESGMVEAVSSAGARFVSTRDTLSDGGNAVVASVRPEALRFSPEGKERSMRARVVDELFIGSRSFLTLLDGKGTRFRVQVQRGANCPPVAPDVEVSVHWADDAVSIFTAPKNN